MQLGEGAAVECRHTVSRATPRCAFRFRMLVYRSAGATGAVSSPRDRWRHDEHGHGTVMVRCYDYRLIQGAKVFICGNELIQLPNTKHHASWSSPLGPADDGDRLGARGNRCDFGRRRGRVLLPAARKAYSRGGRTGPGDSARRI